MRREPKEKRTGDEPSSFVCQRTATKTATNHVGPALEGVDNPALPLHRSRKVWHPLPQLLRRKPKEHTAKRFVWRDRNPSSMHKPARPESPSLVFTALSSNCCCAALVSAPTPRSMLSVLVHNNSQTISSWRRLWINRWRRLLIDSQLCRRQLMRVDHATINLHSL